MDTNILIDFVKFCNQLIPIDIGVICHTDMSDGVVQKINGERVELWHMYKGYEEWWDLKDIISSETNLSKYGINKCLELYIKKCV